MKLAIVGGGPGGLYFALLLKKRFPEVAVKVVERNRPDDTFGFGVVFSDETLSVFEQADPPTFAAIKAAFRNWKEIRTWHRGEWTTSTGHGFSALARRQLLEILQARCRELGVELEFQREIRDFAELGEVDWILAADGVNSWARAQLADQFQPSFDWRRCRFTWLATDWPIDAFTFLFLPTEWGLFQVHAYPYEAGMATFILECREEVWRAAGLENADEAATIAFGERLCQDFLGGHRLYANRSLWRLFPTIRCASWRARTAEGVPVLLLGDAAHTAHFSIGSGTKLAMEDAIALAAEFAAAGAGFPDVERVLGEYEEKRWLDVLKLQRAAQTSLEWFENSARYLPQTPLAFTFNLMTRSKRITFDNLGERDPALVAAVSAEFRAGAPPARQSTDPPPMFTPFRLRDLELANRVVVSPMCQYSAVDGLIQDWHLVHYGSRAIGGAGLLITEMTDVCPEGRITQGCAGLYHAEHVEAWRKVVDFVHANSACKIGVQLAHAGRKSSVAHPWDRGEDVPLQPEQGAWTTCAPSALPYRPHWPAPKAMDEQDMAAVLRDFVRATVWADEAGFDLAEIHMAHGYLLSSFLCPLTNRRDDAYGGDLERRMAYPLRIFRAIRAAWPAHKPLAVRISATDWLDDGMTPDDAVVVSRALAAAGCDLIDVSTAGNVPESAPEYGRMYQVPFADRIRHEAGVAVMAVGAIQGADHANTVLAAGRADLIAMARPHLADAYLTLHAAERYGYYDQVWPPQYWAARPAPPRAGSRKSELDL